MVPFLVYPETSRPLSLKHGWLSFGGLLVNLAALHREIVLVTLCIVWSMATRYIGYEERGTQNMDRQFQVPGSSDSDHDP